MCQFLFKTCKSNYASGCVCLKLILLKISDSISTLYFDRYEFHLLKKKTEARCVWKWWWWEMEEMKERYGEVSRCLKQLLHLAIWGFDIFFFSYPRYKILECCALNLIWQYIEPYRVLIVTMSDV